MVDAAPEPKANMGQPAPRIDGRLKVTGAARYASDIPVANPAFAVLVTSPIAKGKVLSHRSRLGAGHAGRARRADAPEHLGRGEDRHDVEPGRNRLDQACRPLETDQIATTARSSPGRWPTPSRRPATPPTG